MTPLQWRANGYSCELICRSGTRTQTPRASDDAQSWPRCSAPLAVFLFTAPHILSWSYVDCKCSRKFTKEDKMTGFPARSEAHTVSYYLCWGDGASSSATVREMDGRTAEPGDDARRTSEEAAAGLCLQLDLGDTGLYDTQLAIASFIVDMRRSIPSFLGSSRAAAARQQVHRGLKVRHES